MLKPGICKVVDIFLVSQVLMQRNPNSKWKLVPISTIKKNTSNYLNLEMMDKILALLKSMRI